GPRLSLNRANRTYSLLCRFPPGSWPFLKARSILRLEPTPAGDLYPSHEEIRLDSVCTRRLRFPAGRWPEWESADLGLVARGFARVQRSALVSLTYKNCRFCCF